MISSISSDALNIVDLTSLLSAGAAGMLLGCFFYYGLWLSTQKMLGSSHPVLWFVTSWLIRMTTTVCGFYWVGAGNWQPLLACLFGLIVGRWLISRIIVGKKPSSESQQKSLKILDTGAKNAP